MIESCLKIIDRFLMNESKKMIIDELEKPIKLLIS
jgi:hypothetical protein